MVESVTVIGPQTMPTEDGEVVVVGEIQTIDTSVLDRWAKLTKEK